MASGCYKASIGLLCWGIIVFANGNAVLAQTADGSERLSPWRLCAADPLAELLTAPVADDTLNVEGEVLAEADSAEAERGQATLSGNVSVTRGDLVLKAPRVLLDRQRNFISAEDLTLGSPRLAIRGRRGEYDLNQQSGEFEQAEYYLPDYNARGEAEQISVERGAADGGEAVGELRGVSYTTCARDDEFWRLRAAELTLDQASGRGIARNVTLAIKGTPVFYWPYLSFPITDERQSGFLLPRAGYSDDRGADLIVPYYLNIAPNQDATFYPRLMTKRGLALGAEYRYLGSWQRGQLALEYLPDDRSFDDDRLAVRAEHSAQPLPWLRTDLLFQHVSDDEYIDDIGNELDLLSPNYLERRFDLSTFGNVFGGTWQLLSRVQDFQTIDDDLFDDEDEPYERLPQLLFIGSWPANVTQLGPVRVDLRTEWTRFALDSEFEDATGGPRVNGDRFDILPSLSLPLERPWGFLKPRLSYRYTSYSLDHTAPGMDSEPDRGAPIVSVDSGLFFERPTANRWLGDGLLTLEPRLFYLYVPRRDQDDLPLFDTSEIDSSLSALFLENRFTGADRLGDANQLSAALTSRFLTDGDGRERFRVSVGHAYYFDDREVRLERDEPVDDPENSSDWFTEAELSLTSSLSLRGALQWDDDGDSSTERGAFDLRYQPDSSRLVNFSHRYANDELEQLDLSVAWTLNERWRTVGRWNYSLREDNIIDTFAGLEYGDCCWALRMLARHHRDEPDDAQADNSFFVELELKGLTGIGNRIDALLEENISGYEPTQYR